ncbi:MAG: hypothetical protein HWD82_00085 [Flavobacteriaceae bacterium]|nr:hypothetical protein [Flavobacteriaceae bacterium]
MEIKKIVFIVICIIGLVSFSSCRSMSQSCGLADNTTTNQTQVNQVDVL